APLRSRALAWCVSVRPKAERGKRGTCGQMGNYEKRQQRRNKREEGEAPDGARVLPLQELIREEVNLLLRNEIRDRRLGDVSITMVELAPDGSRARLWFSAPENTETLEALAG